MVFGASTTKDFTVVSDISRANHLVHRDIITNAVNGTSFSIFNPTRIRGRNNFVQYGTDSLPGGIFTQPEIFFDIRISGAGVHYLKHITLRMYVTNTSQTLSAIPQLAFYFFNRLEIQPDGGNTEDTIYPIQMYTDYADLTTIAQKAMQGKAIGMNSGGPVPEDMGINLMTGYDEDGIAIPPNGAREYFIPQVGNMFTRDSRVFLPSKKQNPRFRWYTSVNPICSDSETDPDTGATAQLTCVGADAIISGYILDPDLIQSLKSHYMARPSVSRVLFHERQVLDLKSGLVAYTEVSDLSLTVLNGEYAFIRVFITRANATQEGQYSSNRTYDAVTNPLKWVELNRVSLLDSDANPVCFNQIPAEYIRRIHDSQMVCDNFMGSQKNIITWYWCTEPRKTLKNGSTTGGIKFNSNFQFKITPGILNGNGQMNDAGAFQVVILGYRFGNLVQSDKGQFTCFKN